MKLMIILALAILLGACSIFAPTSKDAYTKLKHATRLKSENNFSAATRLSREAIRIFTDRKDVFGRSQALFFLGDVYKSQINWQDVSANNFIDVALLQFKLSQKGFVSIGEKIQASKSTMELASLLWALGDRSGACLSYQNALHLYKSNEGYHKEFKLENMKYKSAGELLQGQINSHCGY